MKNKIILLYVLSLILAITAILSLVFSKDEKNIIIHTTALLNPKYEKLISTIIIHNENIPSKLTIKKYQNNYIGAFQDIVFPIHKGKVEELISLCSHVQNAQLITNEIRDYESYGLSEQSPQKVTIQLSGLNNSNEQDFSTLHFGIRDFSGAKRYVRSSASSTIYAVDDTFYTFLQINPSAWIEPKLIPEYVIEANSTSIDSLVLTIGDHESRIVSGDANFQESIHTLLSLQSSSVVSNHVLSNSTLAFHGSIVFSNKTIFTVAVYKTSANTYVVVPQSQDLFYGLEISHWTFERLLQAFTGYVPQ